LACRHTTAGAADAAIQVALRLLALDPLQEAVYRALMRLHAGRGQRGTALRHYQACAEVLRRELGVEPDAETQRLYREILRQAPPAASARGSEWSEAVRVEATRRAGQRGATLLAGRNVELRQLGGELAAAEKGSGRVVMLLGEAGIGKSRLVEEVVDLAVAKHWRLVPGRSHETERMLALGLWAGALRAGGLPAQRDILARLGSTWQSELVRFLPELADAGFRAPRQPGSELRLFEAIARLLECLAAPRPVLIVLEDLHWADEASLRLTAYLARRIETHPALAVATARVEELEGSPALRGVLAELGREQRVTEIALGPLTHRATRDLVRGLVASGMPDALDEEVWRISAGNPFIAVEAVRAYQEGASLRADGAIALPARARAMLLGRIERLGERSRGLLDVAAVIGRDFEFALLQRASERSGLDGGGSLDEHAAAAGLEELVRRRLAHGLDERFDFTHDRIWEVAYDQISPVRRRVLHGAVARAIEELHAPDLAPRHAALGVHWTKAHVWDRAVVHLRAAGALAASRGAYREAVSLFEQALAALGRIPESAETLVQAIDLRIELRDWLLPLGELDRLAGYVREAEQLASRVGDDRRLAVVSGHLAHYHWLTGRQDRAIACAERTLAIACRMRDGDLVTTGNFYLGEACHALGDYRRAVKVLRENAALTGDRMIARLAGPGLVPVMSRVWYALSLAELGRFTEAIAVLEEALPAVEAIEHPFSLMRISVGLGAVHLARGDLVLAVPALERAKGLVDRWDIALDRAGVGSALGLAYALSRRADEGLSLLERSVDQCTPGERMMSRLSRQLGEGYLVAGRPQEAEQWAGRALDHARGCGGQAEEAWTLRLLADVAASPPAPDRHRALALFDEARSRAEALGMEPLLARCRLGLGRLHARTGDASRAVAELAVAVEATRRLDLGIWRVEAETALARLSEAPSLGVAPPG
jgi:tetratricopeptide (TPR) repeat protein